MPADQPDALARERDRLADLTESFSSQEGFNARLIDFRFESIRPWIAGAKRCLELGSADGRMTERLVDCVEHLTAVDGSEKYVAAVHQRLPSVTAVQALFEEFESDVDYDAIVLGHVLEHVDDPVRVLERARQVLAPEGRILITVPNAKSIHRQIGCAMGLLGQPTDLNEADVRIGHRRVYTLDALLDDVRKAGLTAEHTSGVFLKPLSNQQIEDEWSEELVRAFYEVGKSYPELCAELLVVARGGAPAEGAP